MCGSVISDEEESSTVHVCSLALSSEVLWAVRLNLPTVEMEIFANLNFDLSFFLKNGNDKDVGTDVPFGLNDGMALLREINFSNCGEECLEVEVVTTWVVRFVSATNSP